MKGMAYTSFALLSATLLLGMAFVSVSTVDLSAGESSRISEASFFLQSVLDDMDRSLRIATSRALTGSTAYVVETGNYLQQPEQNISKALVTGEIGGKSFNSTENASLEDWTQKVSDIASRSGYSLKVELRNYSINSSSLSVVSSYSLFAQLKDPATLATFNETKSQDVEVSVEGFEDPLLFVESKGRYVSKYSGCGFSDPSDRLLTSSYSSDGSAYGRVELNPTDLSNVDAKSEKILAVNDVDEYVRSDVNQFAGVISEQPNSTSGYSTEYAFGTGSLSGFEQNDTVILSKGEVWSSGFGKMMFEGCYVSGSDAPGFTDRLGGEFSGKDGFLTLIDVSSLPSELRREDSAVGYEYFDSSDSELWKIRGISQEYSWFRLSDRYVALWSLESIAYK